ncbi:MAG: Hsp20/alpha crystallin family protein [Pirellulales bacterium]|nr:Hsp20/alpha crystallin family protein [Pirellulales bacterium]
MLYTRWQPFGFVGTEMNRLQHEMNRLFNRFGLAESNDEFRVAPSYPALDLWQDGENLYVEAELPGLELDDLEIYVTGGNELTLKGKREAPVVEDGTWHRRERGFGNFSRVMTLPHNVNAEKVDATLKNGVLTVTLPKLENSKHRRITVKAS